MDDEKKENIKEVVENLEKMSKESLLMIKCAANVLRMRDSVEVEEKKAG